MENYFILLGLSFDPIETNEKVIKDAIDAKRDQWQKESKNPRKQIQAKENIAKIPEIEEVMLNPSKRKIEAEKAIKAQQKHISNLKNEILLLSVKGYIEEEEYTNLVSKYAQFSISEVTIEKLLPVPIGDNDSSSLEVEPIDSIPKDIASQLEMYFNNLGYDDMSIYHLYGLDFSASPQDVVNKAQLKLKEMLEKGSKDNKDEIEQKIAGLAVNIFSEMPTRYESYLRYFRFFKLNELIKTAVGNKTLTLRAFNALIKICNQEYNMDAVTAGDYIIGNCTLNELTVSQDVLMEYVRLSENYTEPFFENEPIIEKEIIIEKEQPQKEIIEEIGPKEELNTSAIINQMINPIHNLLINNKNKINQMSNYLNQYKEKREISGSAMSSFLSYGSFLQYGILSIVDLFLLLTMLQIASPLLLMVIVGGIGINIFGIMTIYPAYSQWNKMKNCVYSADKNNKEQDKLYDDFIQLNFNLLIDDNKRIKETLNQIKDKSNNLLKNTSKQYETYTRTSKKYQQKEYYWKINGVSLLLHIGIIAYLIFFLK